MKIYEIMVKLRNLRREKYKEFKKSELYRSLKKIVILRKLKLTTNRVLWKLFLHNFQLHNDPVLQRAFVLIGKEIKPSSIIETGTFLGKSTSFMARHFPQVRIYTSEINEQNYNKARKNLSVYPNVQVYKKSSNIFLNELFDKGLVGRTPLFFLDAHWLDYWPLEDEIKIISEKAKSAIIVIDDFKVPGNPNYQFDRYDNKECSLELIRPHMNKKNIYNILFPRYKEGEISLKYKTYYDLVGYVIIFQNMTYFYNKLSKNEFINKYFTKS